MLALFLNTSKGLRVLNCLIQANLKEYIISVVSYNDKNTSDRSYFLIKELCLINQIIFFDRNESYSFRNSYKLAIGWQYIISDTNKLYIIHDSLLPKYRGFAPTVNAMINVETKIGASIIQSSQEYDKGNIYKQQQILLSYPIKIIEVIKLLEDAYEKLTLFFLMEIISGKQINTIPQDENQATYSLWRNEFDYFIDWEWSSFKIKRFVDAVSFPYDFAKTSLNGEIYRVEEVEIYEDVYIENRVSGKQIFLIDSCPVIVCGQGLIKLINVKDLDGKVVIFKNFRNKFK